MASIKAQQEAFAKKGQKKVSTGTSHSKAQNIGNKTAKKMASIKAQQEAFACKGKRTDSLQVGRGNIAAERMASIKAQQEAFAGKGRKV
eukprot:CAMPEP_0194153232 /NCGR_PEP_ID=MMETSP0152-20130528/55648_1 /TAXON_ID=1049557 /ORGANISM="Thalassiothrix antarctica, Strain L6-D1" /LENGTH=88 /DNA_ID=CAMNT_0038858379 /DNA_START=129 /DNA_END=392 /DNA_ORIENTATION=-